MTKEQKEAIRYLNGKLNLMKTDYDIQFVSGLHYKMGKKPTMLLSDKQNLYLCELTQRYGMKETILKQNQQCNQPKQKKEDAYDYRQYPPMDKETVIKQGIGSVAQSLQFIAEGKVRLLRQIMQEYANGLQDGGKRARLALELSEED